MEAIAKNRRKAAFGRRKPRVGRKEPGEEYREIAEKAALGIMVLQDGSVRYANARARVFFNTLSGELTLESLASRVHPDDRAMVLDRYAQRLRGEEVPKVYSFRVVADDGRVLWLEFSASMIEWEGRPATLVLAENITGRKKLEAELAESERTLRALLDASPAAEFLVGTDGKILIYNRTFERIFGEDGKPLTGRNIQDLLTPEENRVNRSKALEVLSTGKTVFFEDYHRGLCLEKSFSPILDEEGRIAKIACHASNITERKRATEALKDNELRYRLLAENVSDYIWSTDRNLRPTYVSPGVTRLMGYTPEELMAKKLEDLLAPGSLPLVWKAYNLEKAKEKGVVKKQPQPVVLVLEYRRKDGSSFWAETRVMPVFDSEGKTIAVVGITLDISERRKAEKDLRESERRYRLLAENSTDVIWTTDMNLRTTYVSPSVTRMRGYTPEEVMSEPLEKAYSPDSWALIQKVYAEELAEEKKDTRDLSRTRTLELQHRCKDGSLVWGETKISAIRDAEGNIVEILGVTRDITERKKAEETARRLAKENAVMAEIGRIISSGPNIRKVYERFTQEVRKLIEFDNLNINLVNPGERSMTETYASGKPIPGREVGVIIPLEGTAGGEVLRTRSSFFLHEENLEEALGKFPMLRPWVEAGIHSGIIVPLIREGRAFGIFNILSSRPDAYTRADVEIAEKVANQIAGAIANSRLLQELQRMVEALKESEARNRTLVEAAGISGLGIMIFTAQERRKVVCRFANEEAQKITGYSEEELGRIPFLEIIHPAHREAASSQYWDRVGGVEDPILYEMVIRHKKGHTVLIEISAIHAVFRGEKCMIGFLRDISERRRTEEARQESEAKFRELFQNANDLIFLHRLIDDQTPGPFMEVNDLACRKLGYTREQLLGLTPKDITLEFERLVSSVGQKLFTGPKDSGEKIHSIFEATLVAKDGKLFPVEMSFEVFPLKGQRLALTIARDITERKKAEEAARRWAEENALMAEITRIISSSLNIEEVYEHFAAEVRKLIEFDNLTISMINPDGKSLVVAHSSGTPVPGREVGTVFPLEGTATKEIYKTRSSLFIPKENLEEALRKFPKLRDAFKAGMQSMIFIPLISEDRVFGSLTILSSRPDAYTRAEVEIAEKVAIQIAGAIAKARLFQEWQSTMEALRESEAKFRELFYHANDLIFLHRVDNDLKPGPFMEVNDVACRELGYTREELLGLSPLDVSVGSEKVGPRVIQEIAARLNDSGGSAHYTFEDTYAAKDGRLIPAEVSLMVFPLKGQKMGLAIARNITERKKAEREMIKYQAHLEEKVRERTAKIQELEQQRTEIKKIAAAGVLAARIAHEINNPLAGIKGSFMLIQDAILPDHPYHHYVGRIHGEINRIARIVRQMFELYRSPEEDQEEWGIDQMIQDVVALLKDEAREREVSFQLPVLPLKVRVPAGPIRQVLFNVIKNAVEASPVEGQVRVSVQGKEKEISIQVADEGPGISEKNRPHVFKPFFSTKKGRQKGLGLGLSISKEIIESLGGAIRLQNLREKGLLCQIDLPKRKRKKENWDV